jgi:peptidase inhibitor family I36
MTNSYPRKGAALAAAAAASSMAVPALSSPTAASARAPSETCPGNILCEWKHNGFNLPVKWWPVDHDAWNYDLDRYDSDTSQGLNQSISAVWNNTNRWVGLYSGPNNGGDALCLKPGAAAADLSKVKYGGIFGVGELNFNDKLTSHEFYLSDPGGCDKTLDRQGCSL